MNNININLHIDYDLAVKQAAQIGEECNTIVTNYPSDTPLYKKTNVKSIIIDILFILLGLLLAVLGIIVLFSATPFAVFSFIFPAGYISALLLGISGILLFTSVFSLYKMISFSKSKHDTKEIIKLAANISIESNGLPEFDKQVRKAIECGNDLIIEPKGYWQTKLNQYKKIMGERTTKDGKTNQLIHTIAAGSILLFALIFFWKFIVGGYMLEYGKASGAIVAVSYLLIGTIMAESLLHLVNWYRNTAKIYASAIFGVYQISVILALVVKKAFNFTGTTDGSKGTEISDFLFNYPILSILFFTAIIAFLILKPNYSEVYGRMGEKVIIPLDNGTTRDDTPKSPMTMLRKKCILRIPVFIVTGVWMSNIINKSGDSFWKTIGYIVLYIVIMIIHFVISTTLDQTFDILYGEISMYYTLLVFVCYVVVVLSLVPGFGLGTLILLGIHAAGAFVASKTDPIS